MSVDDALNALATARVPSAQRDQPAGAVRTALVGRRFDSVAAVVVLDGDRLTGVLPLEALLAAPPDVPVGAIMDSHPPVLTPDGDHDRAA